MDGRKRTIKPHSLQQNLNHWILVVSGVFALLAGILSGVIAFIEAQEVQDFHLQQIGELLIHKQISSGVVRGGDDGNETLVVQRLQAGYPRELPIALDHPDGLYSLKLQDEYWRTLILTLPHPPKTPPLRFAIAQQTQSRNELAWESSLQSFLAVLLLAPLLMGLIHLIIRHSFKPLSSLSEQVNQRVESDITPLPEHDIPQEITPFIVSINQLLVRINHVLIQQRRFVSDAAHELRTPLTALSLLTENLSRANNQKQIKQRLIPIQKGMIQMQVLVNQLLSLARMQGKPPTEARAVNLRRIVQEAIAALYPLAESKSIDLGMTQQKNITLLDTEDSLSLLVRNAIDNAIRYTPKGGKVDVSLFVKEGQGLLQVRDNGSGIPENELPQVFEPFYRATGNRESGNGLGLTISLEIANRLGGEILLQNHPQEGLLFIYRQPLIKPEK